MGAVTNNYFSEFQFSRDVKCSYLYAAGDVAQHKHVDFYEFSLIIRGQYKNTYDKKTYSVQNNSLLFFKKGEQHSMVRSEPNSLHFSFIVEENFFEEVFEHFFPKHSLLDLGKYIEKKLSNRQCEYLNELANKLLDNTLLSERELLIELFLFNALSSLLISERIETKKKSNQFYAEQLLERLNDFRYINYSVAEIYKDYPIAQTTIIESFKALTGNTIIQYHKKKKLEYAAQLLASECYSISEICSKANYNCLTHFSKIFKDYYGISPKEYQKRLARHYDDPEKIS